MYRIALSVVALWISVANAAVPEGEYASALSVDDERVQIRLLSKGKAQIIAEHNFLMPGDETRRRGRTTSYAKWSQKGDIVTLTYSRVTDRLRYNAKTPLAALGLQGSAPGLAIVKPIHSKSRLRIGTFWKAPHDYRMKASESGPTTPSAPRGASEPAR